MFVLGEIVQNNLFYPSTEPLTSTATRSSFRPEIRVISFESQLSTQHFGFVDNHFSFMAATVFSRAALL